MHIYATLVDPVDAEFEEWKRRKQSENGTKARTVGKQARQKKCADIVERHHPDPTSDTVHFTDRLRDELWTRCDEEKIKRVCERQLKNDCKAILKKRAAATRQEIPNVIS
jgi:hypothetical protein